MRAVADGVIPRATWDKLGTVTRDDGAIERHIAAVLALPMIDVARIRARKFTVALDCVRGAGGVILPALLERLGCSVTAINLETRRTIPSSAGTGRGEPGRARAARRECDRRDVGFATDPDVDRLALVSEAGRAIGEDWTLALAARLVLRSRPGPLVANLSTSRIVDDVAREAGARWCARRSAR